MLILTEQVQFLFAPINHILILPWYSLSFKEKWVYLCQGMMCLTLSYPAVENGFTVICMVLSAYKTGDISW